MIRRLFMLLSLTVLGLFLAPSISSANAKPAVQLGSLEGQSRRIESLKERLASENNPNEQIKILWQLVNIHVDQPEEVTWLKEIRNVASKQHNKKLIDQCEMSILHNYMMRNMKDSVEHYHDLVLQKSTSPQFKLSANSMYISFLLSENKFYEVFDLMPSLKKEADDLGTKDAGFDYKYTLALVYFYAKQYDKTIDILEQMIYKEKPGFIMLLMSRELLAKSYMKSNRFDEAKLKIDEFDKFVNEIVINADITSFNPYRRSQYMVQVLYFDCYVRGKKFDKAETYLHTLMNFQTYRPTLDDLVFVLPDVVTYEINYNDFEKAIANIDFLIANTSLRHAWYLSLKASIYEKTGDKALAARTYDEVCKAMQTETESNFSRELEQYKKAEQELEIEKEAKAKDLDRSHKIRWVLLVLCLAAFVFLIFMNFYSKHVKQIKVDLRKSEREIDNEKSKIAKINSSLQRTVNEAIDSNNKKIEFINGISHEIRTPLNSIIGFSQVIAAAPDTNDETREFANLILESSDTMIKLVNEIVESSKLSIPDSNMKFSTCDVVELGKSIVKLTEPLLKSNVKIYFYSNRNSINLFTDTLRIKQMLTNLLGNAAKFTNEGSIRLEIIEANDNVTFSVTDTGIGIPPEERQNVFERYSKINELSNGTGLGLFITSRIAKQLRGEIFVDPDYDKGARFVFVHPRNLEDLTQSSEQKKGGEA